MKAVSGPVELDGDGPAHEPLEIGGALQCPFQTGGADLEMIGALEGVLLVQDRVHSAGDGFAVVDVHAAFLIQVQPQVVLAALTDIFHIPEFAAVCFHDGLCKACNQIGYFHFYLIPIFRR